MTREKLPRGSLLPALYRKLEYDRSEYEQITVDEFFDICTPEDLRHYRAVINGKLSRRTITPEQQAAMQAARADKKQRE